MKIKKGAAVSDENLEGTAGGFTQHDPGVFWQMQTTIDESEAEKLNKKLGLTDPNNMFYAGTYDRDDFAEKGIKSRSGNDLRNKLKDMGLIFKGRG